MVLELLYLAILCFGPFYASKGTKTTLKGCHLGIQPISNPSLWECGFDPQDLQNIRVCEFRLEFLSYKKKKKTILMGSWVGIPTLNLGLREFLVGSTLVSLEHCASSILGGVIVFIPLADVIIVSSIIIIMEENKIALFPKSNWICEKQKSFYDFRKW